VISDLVMYPSGSQGRVGGALHSALSAPVDVDAGNGLHSPSAWRDATPFERVFNGLSARNADRSCRVCRWRVRKDVQYSDG
jgi:hypothetical protein